MLREVFIPRSLENVPIHPEDEDVPKILQYPANFAPAMGVGRIAFLCEELLWHYNCLAQIIGWRHSKRKDYQKAMGRVFPLKDLLLDNLVQTISEATLSIENTVRTIAELIGEIDAIGGAESIYVPDVLKNYLGAPRYRVASKSLAYLAEPSHYIDEVYNEAPEELSGYKYLAVIVNRMKYYDACGCQDIVQGLREKVRSCCNGLSIRKILSMPDPLWDEIGRILPGMLAERINKAKEEYSDLILCPDSQDQLEDNQNEENQKMFMKEQQHKKLEEEKDDATKAIKQQKEKEKMQKDSEEHVENNQNEENQKKFVKEQQIKKLEEEKDCAANPIEQQKEKDKMQKVYDAYMENAEMTSYPWLPIVNELNCSDDELEYGDDYPYETDDSNDAENPMYDYPDEPGDGESDDSSTGNSTDTY